MAQYFIDLGTNSSETLFMSIDFESTFEGALHSSEGGSGSDDIEQGASSDQFPIPDSGEFAVLEASTMMGIVQAAAKSHPQLQGREFSPEIIQEVSRGLFRDFGSQAVRIGALALESARRLSVFL